MKYHEYSNIAHYRTARERNLSSRDEAYGGPSFEQRYQETEVRELCERIAPDPSAAILVIGTGTGADSCWLADQGYQVTGIDIVQDAIHMAKAIAQKRGTLVTYRQDDICNIKHEYGDFDVVIDSFCLQSIVSDRERNKVFSFVKSHLRPEGHYLVISAGYSTRKAYNDAYFRDENTGIVYQIAKKGELELDDVELINGKAYLPVRRHHTIDMLVHELERNGFRILHSDTEAEWGALKVIASA